MQVFFPHPSNSPGKWRVQLSSSCFSSSSSFLPTLIFPSRSTFTSETLNTCLLYTSNPHFTRFLLDRLGARSAPLALEEQVQAAYEKRLADCKAKA